MVSIYISFSILKIGRFARKILKLKSNSTLFTLVFPRMDTKRGFMGGAWGLGSGYPNFTYFIYPSNNSSSWIVFRYC